MKTLLFVLLFVVICGLYFIGHTKGFDTSLWIAHCSITSALIAMFWVKKI
jgi:hypothetical protein